jgi:chromosome segregation ATPase
MVYNFAFFMDISILALLAATVFLAFRLTMSLRTFKESRFEMEGLVNRLNANVDKAEKAIHGMQNTARKAGLELDEVISDAKKLKEELKLMSESGNNLATRLENIALRNRELVDQIENMPSPKSEPIRYNIELPRALQGEFEDDLDAEFAIRDRDLGIEEEFDDDGEPGLQSQAERELFEALQNSKIRQRGRA